MNCVYFREDVLQRREKRSVNPRWLTVHKEDLGFQILAVDYH